MIKLGVGLVILLSAGGERPREAKKIESTTDSLQIENTTQVNLQTNRSGKVSPKLERSTPKSSNEKPTTQEHQNERKSKLLLHLPRLEGETNVTFSDVQQEMVASLEEEEEAKRMVRIGDNGKYVPFNSMTFNTRNQALQAVTEAGDTSTRTTTVPWWKKLKENKKKGNKNKKWWNKKNKKKNKFSSTRRTTQATTRPTQRRTTSRTTRSTRRPTKRSTTWFPLTLTSSTTESGDYFKRPVVHEDDNSKDKDDEGKLDKDSAEKVIQDEHDDFAEEDNILKDALVNSIFTSHNEVEKEEETGVRQLPTLTQVAGLFDDFYSYAEYYPWKLDVEIVKKFFLKILEDFLEHSFKDRRKLMKFLQKQVYLYSRLSSSAMKKVTLDEELFQRYNFIVTDLAKRKIRLTTGTKSALQRDPSTEKPQGAHKNLLIMNNRVVLDTASPQKVTGDKSVIDKTNRDKSEASQKKYNVIKNFFGQKRPTVDLGPYWSSERPALRPVQFYPQTSGWPEGEVGGQETVEINPMFGQKPFLGQESEVLFGSSAGGETGTGNTSCSLSLELSSD